MAYWSGMMRRETVDAVMEAFNMVLNTIDYQRYPVQDEAACRSHLQMLLIGAGLAPVPERHSACVRSDLEVDAGARRWGFELKYADDAAQAGTLLQKAVEQMQSRRYGETVHGKELI